MAPPIMEWRCLVYSKNYRINLTLTVILCHANCCRCASVASFPWSSFSQSKPIGGKTCVPASNLACRSSRTAVLVWLLPLSSDVIHPQDMFDPSVFDIRMVMGVLVCVALIAYAIFRLFVRK